MKTQHNRRFVFSLITIGLPIIFTILLFIYCYPYIKEKLKPQITFLLTQTLSKQEISQLVNDTFKNIGFCWTTIPEPLVNRIAKRGYTGSYKQTNITINNAGMRSKKPFTPKQPSVYRIVCLGDSFVFGDGVPEKDRFCDQMEDYYKKSRITVKSKRIETLSIGISGWTALQEAHYLTSRISAYDPDIILLLAIPNDITDSNGITGYGAMTKSFTPEYRHLGSSVFSNTLSRKFGLRKRSSIESAQLSNASRIRWDKAMDSLKRLVDLQHKRGKNFLISILDWTGKRDTEFVEQYLVYLNKTHNTAPSIITSFFPGPETSIPNDGHPNRMGHTILSQHYIYTFNKLGWVKSPDSVSLNIDQRLNLEISPKGKQEMLKELRHKNISQYLRSDIIFTNLLKEESWGFLGGIFPESTGEKSTSTPPWASQRVSFLMKSPSPPPRVLQLEIAIPNKIELYPFNLSIKINGKMHKNIQIATYQNTNNSLYNTEIIIQGTTKRQEVMEISMQTSSYFCDIEDHRMKSFQLVRAVLK